MGLLDYLLKGSKHSQWLNHRTLYLLGLATIVCGLAWSNALMSIGQFILLGNWIIELGFKNKLKRLKENNLIWVLISIYLLHLLGLLWTENFEYAIKDLRVKLPLLSLPIIIGTTKKLSLKEWKGIISIYLTTLFLLTLASLVKLSGFLAYKIIDKRELSIYISHIRYGLNIAFGIFLLLELRFFTKKKNLWLTYLMSIWFLVCLVLFGLYTGLVCIVITAFFYLLYLKSNSKRISSFLKVLNVFIVLVISYGIYTIYGVYQDFKTQIDLEYDQDNLIANSNNGTPYSHDTSSVLRENGVYLYRFIAFEELKSEWNKRSEIAWGKEDLKQNHIGGTLIRFLSSKGLKKDSVGVSKLKSNEIEAIEKGIANVYYLNHSPLKNRIYATFYEIQTYQETGWANGFSLVMRYEFWKTAAQIIRENPIKGVGTGDIQQAFKKEYVTQNSVLDEEYRRRAHNQFITFFATFGFIGILIFIFYLFFPLLNPLPNKRLYFVFFAILTISFLTEDTLETQAGVTLFALFNSLLLLGLKDFSSKQIDTV